MGLTICRRIILNSGGSISFFSEGENKGSTFVFSIEMKLVDSQLQSIQGQDVLQMEQFLSNNQQEVSFSSYDSSNENNILQIDDINHLPPAQPGFKK